MSTSGFFKFSHNTIYNSEFAWAWRIHPQSEMIYQKCPECGTIEHYPSGTFDVSVEGGTAYPDVLGCGEFPFLIVSEAVVEAWRKANITCFHTYEVGVNEVQSKALEHLPPPHYFRIEIDGRCRIDLAMSGVDVIRLCPRCHHLVTRPSLIPGFHIVSDSWDGCDLFRDVDLFPRVSFCTELVLKLAQKHRHTNFRFEPMGGPFQSGNGGFDYLRDS